MFSLHDAIPILANLFLGIMLEAIEQSLSGYEQLDEQQTERLAHHLTHGMWGLCVGLSSTAQSGYASTLCPEHGEESNAHFTTNYTNLLKGYGWQETDTESVFERCKAIASNCMDQTVWFSNRHEDQ